jgi:transcriptional regulator with XRE-family HTH domain
MVVRLNFDCELVLPARIRRYMEIRTLSMEALAERSGLHRSHLWRICNRLSSPKLGTLHRIAQALDVTIGDLVDHAGPEAAAILHHEIELIGADAREDMRRCGVEPESPPRRIPGGHVPTSPPSDLTPEVHIYRRIPGGHVPTSPPRPRPAPRVGNAPPSGETTPARAGDPVPAPGAGDRVVDNQTYLTPLPDNSPPAPPAEASPRPAASTAEASAEGDPSISDDLRRALAGAEAVDIIHRALDHGQYDRVYNTLHELGLDYPQMIDTVRRVAGDGTATKWVTHINRALPAAERLTI